MFESFDELMDRLKATGYFIDPVMTRIVFLAAKLQKPLLLEGPAGSGKFGTCCRLKAAKTGSLRRASTTSSPNTSCSVMWNSLACCSPKRSRLTRSSIPPHSSQFPCSIKLHKLEEHHASIRKPHSLARKSLRPRRSRSLSWHRHGARSLSRQPEGRCRIPAQLSALRPSSVNSTARGLANSLRALVFSHRFESRYASQQAFEQFDRVLRSRYNHTTSGKEAQRCSRNSV